MIHIRTKLRNNTFLFKSRSSVRNKKFTKYTKLINKNKKVSFYINKSTYNAPNIFNFNNQLYNLFHKRRFGLFKNSNLKDKLIKKQLIYLSNYIRHGTFQKSYKLPRLKTRIIFYKKLNKLFFRSGRALFTKLFNFKKSSRQTFVSKRIFNVIKNDWSKHSKAVNVYTLLLKTNLFLSRKESYSFISAFGVWVGSNIIYNPECVLVQSTTFSLLFSRKTLNFFHKKRKRVIANLRNIKFFKFRSKMYIARKIFLWAPSIEWIYEHEFLYFYKNSSIEFDIRTLSGVYIYSSNYVQPSKFVNMSDISIYMTRSYTWKYII